MTMLTKCLICGGIYPEDEIVFHLETNHSDIIEERGLFECFQPLEEQEIERLPYYGYTYRIPSKKYPKKYYYYCDLDGQEFEDQDALVTHCLKEHKGHPDTFNILKQWAKENIVTKMKEKDFEKLKEEKQQQNIFRELSTSVGKDALEGFATDYYNRLFEFMTGQDPVCASCARDIDHMELSDKEKYITKRIIESLKAGMHNLSKEDEQSFNKLVERKYEGKILNREVDLSLKSLLHLHTAHPLKLKTLVEEGIVSGALPEYLVYEKYNKPETLSKSKPSEKKSKLSTDALHAWLSKRPS